MLPIKIQFLMERASGRVLGMVKSLGKFFNTSRGILLFFFISLLLPFFSFLFPSPLFSLLPFPSFFSSSFSLFLFPIKTLTAEYNPSETPFIAIFHGR